MVKLKKAIIIRIFGGLGNQLFIYALGRHLSIKYRLPLYLALSFDKDFYNRFFCLHHFNINATILKSNIFNNIYFSNNHFYKIFRRIWRNYESYLQLKNKKFIYEEHDYFDKRILNLNSINFLFLEGYWQSEKYFKDIEHILRSDLNIITPHSIDNINIADGIIKSNSVCIHARRWHAKPGGNKKINKESEQILPCHQPLDIDYYHTAVNEITKLVPKPVFYCFGDDIDWVKTNIKINYPTFYIEHNRGDEKSYEDLWLMSLCKHFIIANSSFSWWGAWLSKNINKIVIAPRKITGSNNKDFIPENWIKI